MRFLIDAQLSSSFARVLRDWGYDAEQVFDLGMAAAADADIWRHAIQRSSVIVTKDSDVAARRRASPTGPVVVWIRFGNTSKAALLRKLLPLMPRIAASIDAGETVIEVR